MVSSIVRINVHLFYLHREIVSESHNLWNSELKWIVAVHNTRFVVSETPFFTNPNPNIERVCVAVSIGSFG